MPRITVNDVALKPKKPNSLLSPNAGMRLHGVRRITGSTTYTNGVFHNNSYANKLSGGDLERVDREQTRFMFNNTYVEHIDGGTMIQPVSRLSVTSGAHRITNYITWLPDTDKRHVIMVLVGAGGSGGTGGRGSANGGGGGGSGGVSIGVLPITKQSITDLQASVGTGGSAVATNKPGTNGDGGGSTTITGNMYLRASGGDGGRAGGGAGGGRGIHSSDGADFSVQIDMRDGAKGGTNGAYGNSPIGALAAGGVESVGNRLGSGTYSMSNLYSGGTSVGYPGGAHSSVHSASNRSREGGGGAGGYFGRGGAGANSGGGAGGIGAGGAGSASRSGLVHTGPSGAGGSGKFMMFY